ncbi:conserved Plasmodium protein, unknown function, partial [Plasmodium malariae]
KKVLGNKNVSDSDLINVTSTDFLKLILTLDEQKITSCDIAPDIRGDENNSEDKDEFKMIQDYRRYRAIHKRIFIVEDGHSKTDEFEEQQGADK